MAAGSSTTCTHWSNDPATKSPLHVAQVVTLRFSCVHRYTQTLVLLPDHSMPTHKTLAYVWMVVCPQVSLEKYLASPEQYITEVPSQSDLAAPEQRPHSIDGITGSTSRSSSNASRGGGKSGMGPGEIAGIVVGVVAGLAILGTLAYFVGYKKLYVPHKATSFKRSDIPEGPGKSTGAAGVRKELFGFGCCQYGGD